MPDIFDLKITDIFDLEIDEVSLCDVGANQDAHVRITKLESLRHSTTKEKLPATATNRAVDAERELIYKCLEACDTGDLRYVRKADFENALDVLAKRYSNQTGHTYAAAYAELLESDLGNELYTGLDVCERAEKF